jgi:predicted amidohydrolase YtcJ
MGAGGLIARGLIGAYLAVMVSALWLAAADAVEDGNADVVLRNGKIYTADKERSIKEAIAFKGNTIVAVGIDKDMAPLIGSATKVIDLGGRLVLLGLIDTHIHPIIGALNGAKCSLARVKATIEALKPVLQECLAKEQGGADDWFEAAQLDNYGFSATAKDLDTIEAARPVALWGNDGHTVWVNSRGLALLGRDG